MENRQENIQVPYDSIVLAQSPVQGNKMFKGALISTAVALLLGLGSYTFLQSENHQSVESFLQPEVSDKHFTKYLQFISEYGKTTYSQSEFQRRYKIFHDKVESIEEHNRLY